MDILLSGEHIVFCNHSIDFGTYEGENKWRICNEDGITVVYALDRDYHVEHFNGNIPEDVENSDKYLFHNGNIILNPDWVAPPPTEEQRIRALEQIVADQDALLADILLSI